MARPQIISRVRRILSDRERWARTLRTEDGAYGDGYRDAMLIAVAAYDAAFHATAQTARSLASGRGSLLVDADDIGLSAERLMRDRSVALSEELDGLVVEGEDGDEYLRGANEAYSWAAWCVDRSFTPWR